MTTNRLTKRIAAIAALGVAMAGTAGCSRVLGYQGYISDATLVDAIQPGVDNRESVQKTLGRPTFVGQFTPDEWYYFSRQTKQLAFANPTPTQQNVLRVRFDAAGNVVAVDKSGVEKVARISPESDKTPTLGRERTLFEDLFGNIGAVGATSQSGGTADNPN